MTYEIGQLYHCSMQGIICITQIDIGDIFDTPALPPSIFSNHRRIGRYVRLTDNREYSLTDRKQYSIATDEDIVDFLINQMLYFKISNNASIAFYKDCDLVYIGDATENVAIHRNDIVAIIALLQRECNL
jgi:hypothetical protein